MSTDRARFYYGTVHGAIERVVSVLARRAARRGSSAPCDKIPRRLLLLKFGGMGEAVLARAISEHLRARHPEMQIDVLVDARTHEVMTWKSGANALIYEPRADGLWAAWRVLRAVRAARYDAAIDFEQVSMLTAAFLYASNIPVRVGFIPPDDERRRVFLSHTVALREGHPMWQAMADLARVIDPGLPDKLSTVPIPVGAAATQIDQWWQANVRPDTGHVVAMHLGVGPRAQYRLWPLVRFVELARKLKEKDPRLEIVVTGEQAERPLVERFKALYGAHVADATALGSIRQTAALVRQCDLLISADTGLMHLGAAVGTPTVGIFGPNTPKCWAPVGPRATFVYVTNLPCSPCINSYRRIIPDDCTFAEKSRCMLDVSANHVVEAARRVVRDRWLD